MILLLFLAALVSVVLGFGFAAVDSSLSRIGRHTAEDLIEQKRRGADALGRLVKDTSAVAMVLAFLRVAAEATAAVLVTLAVREAIDSFWVALVIAIVVMAIVSFVLVGVSPRTLGRQHAIPVALGAAPVVLWLHRILGPIARALVAVGNAVTPGRGYRDGPFDTEEELREYVDMATDSELIEDDERKMIQSVFELDETVVRELMVPRPDMLTIDAGKTLGQAMRLFLRSGFSRVPVSGGSSDAIDGVLYFKDVAARVFRHDEMLDHPVSSVTRDVTFVPDSKPADDLLREMQLARRHFAIVIDEYGGTAGLVTLEDIIEEVVGEIDDEFDRVTPGPEPLPDGAVRVPARMSVDDLADYFDVTIEDDDVETVGGLLAKLVGRVPIPGAAAQVEGLRLVAERLAGRRHQIATVLVHRVPTSDESQHDGNRADTGADAAERDAIQQDERKSAKDVLQ